jgi:hypothetical protein
VHPSWRINSVERLKRREGQAKWQAPATGNSEMKLASVITRPVRPPAIAIAAMAVAALLSVPVLAQSSDDSGLQSGQRWNDALARAETYARVRAPSDLGLSFHREQLGRIRKEAFRVRDAAQQRLVELEQVIVLLGPGHPARAPNPNRKRLPRGAKPTTTSLLKRGRL